MAWLRSVDPFPFGRTSLQKAMARAEISIQTSNGWQYSMIMIMTTTSSPMQQLRTIISGIQQHVDGNAHPNSNAMKMRKLRTLPAGTRAEIASCSRDKTVWIWECFLPGTIDRDGNGSTGVPSSSREAGDFECLVAMW